MRLTFDQIKSITVGSVNTWQESDGFHFAKCTEKQIAAWNAIDIALKRNAIATTGVRLDFHTTSKHFAFSTPLKSPKYEIYINNVMMHQLLANDFSNGVFEMAIDSEHDENRITLILPSHDDPAVLGFVELDDGATLVPHKFDCKLLFIGDSITQGWESGYDSLSYAYRVSSFFNAESIINGVGGGIFHESTFDPNIDFEPDAVIVAYGTNDWGRNPDIETLKGHANAFLSLIAKRYAGRPIFGISPIWRGEVEGVVRGSGTFDEICNAVKKAIADNGLILIDGRTLTPHMPQFFSDKTLHPNAIGFGIYAQNLISILKNYIKS